jgi:hypothetical protein
MRIADYPVLSSTSRAQLSAEPARRPLPAGQRLWTHRQRDLVIASLLSCTRADERRSGNV